MSNDTKLTTRLRSTSFMDQKQSASDIYVNNAAPPGVNYLSRKHGRCKRFFWLCLILAGLIYPSYNFIKQLRKYLQFPSSVKPIKDLEKQQPELSFPKVTLCANGIHSMSRIHEFYPWLPHSLSEKIYDSENLNLSEIDPSIIEKMQQLDFDEFANKTKSQLRIVGCKYLKTKDCSPEANPNAWTLVHTPFGYCHTLNPSVTYPSMRDQYFAYGRQVELNLISIHNDTDGVGGPFQHYSGLTLFYSDSKIESLSRFNSITVAPHDVPIISFMQYHEKNLNPPYSDCYKPNEEYKLRYYDYYAYEHCINECFAETILQACGCVSHSYLRNTTQVIDLKQRDEGQQFKRCTLYDQMSCVSNTTRYFKEENCKNRTQLSPGMKAVCKKACKFDRPEAGLIQYGRYKYAASVAEEVTANGSDSSFGLENVIAAVLYLSDLDEITLLESEDYKWPTFLSNVGGGAGLLLGLSAASILGAFDLLVVTILDYLKKLFEERLCPLSHKSKQRLEVLKALERRNSYETAIIVSTLSDKERKLL